MVGIDYVVCAWYKINIKLDGPVLFSEMDIVMAGNKIQLNISRIDTTGVFEF